MSGGSYEYLYMRDASNLHEYLGQLEKMAERLAGLGYAQDAARETYQLLLMARQYDTLTNIMIRRLQTVWHNVEWWDSNDGGEDGVKEALARYRTLDVRQFISDHWPVPEDEDFIPPPPAVPTTTPSGVPEGMKAIYVPEDVPYFLVKGTDMLAVMPVAAWIDAAYATRSGPMKVNEAKIKGAEEDLAAIQMFQRDHPERVKVPD